MPSVVDGTVEEEWVVEEICDDRELDDGGVELLVKWKGGEETWEPYENVAETEALDEYERLHGPVSLIRCCLRFCLLRAQSSSDLGMFRKNVRVACSHAECLERGASISMDGFQTLNSSWLLLVLLSADVGEKMDEVEG
jgi:hypothetical protein